MDPIRRVKFDIHGTDPANTIVGEVIKLTDKTCQWVIPDGAPFFAEPGRVVVYNARGGILVGGRDYFLEEEFVPFCEATGRSAKCFIRLPQEILDDNAQIKVDYQSLGAFFVPRSLLQGWLDQLSRKGLPITWDKVLSLPATFPPASHKHSAKTEVTDWYELSWFFSYLQKVTATRDPEANNKVSVQYRLAYTRLTSAKTTRLAQLKAHDEDYTVPHDTTKFDILLGNHDNFATATLAEDLAGARKDLLSTPMGVGQLAKTFVQNTDAAMLRGIMPLSRFGGDSFIPPNISGSFEGMGQQTECSGICLESSGLLMLLSNHMDGRTQGLYFSVVENYNKNNIRVTYTNYKYRPPSLAALGVDVNRIIAGSGNKVIMVGVLKTDDWFIALTNNTFDPAAHVYSRCNMSALTAKFGTPYGDKESYGNHDQATIHHMGVYLVLIQSWVDLDGVGRQRFYRVLTEDVRAGRPVTWTAISLTYTDWDGTQYTGVTDFVMQKITRNAQSLVTRFGRFVGAQPFDGLYNLRRALTLSCPQTDGGGNYFLRMVHYYHMGYRDLPYTSTMAGICEMSYVFNPATGVFVQQAKSPQVTIDFRSTPGNNDGTRQSDHWYANLVAFNQPASVLLSTGEVVSSHVLEAGGEFPVRLKVMKFTGVKSPEGLLSKLTIINTGMVESGVLTTPAVIPATNNGTFPSSMTYESDGEIFTAIDQESPSLDRRVYYRQVSGGYAIRDGVNNLNVANILSRPLTSAIYKANLSKGDGNISLTGSQAELTAGGVECGSGSLSMCAYSSSYPLTEYLPGNPVLRAPAAGNVLMSFPRTYVKTLDPVKKEATFTATTFFGFRQAMLDLIKSWVPIQTSPQWCFTLNYLNSSMGGMFKGLDLAVVSVDYFDAIERTPRTRLILARPTVEAPNTDHPGVHLITNLVVLSSPTPVVAFQTTTLGPEVQYRKHSNYLGKPAFTGYRDGSKIKVVMVDGFSIYSAGNGESAPNAIFDINLTTNAIENIACGGVGSGYGDIAVMIPKYGMTDVTLVTNNPASNNIVPVGVAPYQYTGGGAQLYWKTGVGCFLYTSVYPETGWVLFCQPNIRMMVNGSLYEMAGGNIDLRDIDPAPQNKTFYVYATVEDDVAKYIITPVKMRKSGNMLKAATVVTNDKQILTIVRHQPLTVGPYQLSYTREGGTIPMSTGFPQDEGDFPFLRSAELLP